MIVKKNLILLGLCLLSFLGATAQKMLQMDKFGKNKSMNFYIGDEVTMKLSGEDGFHTVIIQDILADQSMIMTQFGPIHTDRIEAIRTFKIKKVGKWLSLSFWNFGASYVGYSLIAALVGEPLGWGVLIVGAVCAGVGLLAKLLFKKRTYRIGKRRGIRTLDLTPVPFAPSP